ncbi:MAG: twin-arginine translocase TatA/TatE family subunit [Mariprofundaceae bacterium]|nr:twin-arginine translocase TatA/TatE family subunit [Mariprofundaceae bacterium]
MGLGTTELILILVIVLVFFGARKLPEIGSGLAKGIKSFRKVISDDPAGEDAQAKEETQPKEDTQAKETSASRDDNKTA